MGIKSAYSKQKRDLQGGCRAGEGKPSVKGQVGNVLCFMGYLVLQLFNSATVAPKQPETVSKCIGMAVCQQNLIWEKKIVGQICSLTICDIETSRIDGRVAKTLDPR